jgi:hypothetical protein
MNKETYKKIKIFYKNNNYSKEEEYKFCIQSIKGGLTVNSNVIKAQTKNEYKYTIYFKICLFVAYCESYIEDETHTFEKSIECKNYVANMKIIRKNEEEIEKIIAKKNDDLYLRKFILNICILNIRNVSYITLQQKDILKSFFTLTIFDFDRINRSRKYELCVFRNLLNHYNNFEESLS